MSVDSVLNDDGSCDTSSVRIPVPQEFVDEFKEFFNNSNDKDNYKFIFNLDQILGGSIWTENSNSMANTSSDKVVLEKPVGMKTLDHYFNKQSRGVKKGKSLSTGSSELKRSSISPQKNSVSSSHQSKKSSGNSSLSKDNDILSQDIFSNNCDEINHDSDDEMILSTQAETSSLSKFSSSALVSRSSCNDSSSSELDREKKSKRTVSSKRNINEPPVSASSDKNPHRDSTSDSEGSVKDNKSFKEKRKSESPTKAPIVPKIVSNVNNSSSSSSEDEDVTSSKGVRSISSPSFDKVTESGKMKSITVSNNSVLSGKPKKLNEDVQSNKSSSDSGNHEMKPQVHSSIKGINIKPNHSDTSSSSSDCDEDANLKKTTGSTSTCVKELYNSNGDISIKGKKKKSSSSSSDTSLDEDIKKKTVVSVKSLSLKGRSVSSSVQNRNSDLNKNPSKLVDKEAVRKASLSSSDSDQEKNDQSFNSLHKQNKEKSSPPSDKKEKHPSVNTASRLKHEVSSSSDEDDLSITSKSAVKSNEIVQKDLKKNSSTSGSDGDKGNKISTKQGVSNKSPDSSSSSDEEKIKSMKTVPFKERNMNLENVKNKKNNAFQDKGKSLTMHLSNKSSSSSDENEFSFKNKDIGKMLGLNQVSSARNMSCSAANSKRSDKVKRDNVADLKKVEKVKELSSSEDSQDEDLNKMDVKDQTSVFAPGASSSFMVSTPRNISQNHLNKEAQSESKKHSSKGKTSSSAESSSVTNSQDTVIPKNPHTNPNHEGSSDSESVSPQSDPQSCSSKKRRCSDIDDSDGGSTKQRKKNRSERESIQIELNDEPANSNETQRKHGEVDPQTWLENFIKKKRLIQAEERLKEDNAFCFEDLSSDDELYTLQCPKELNIFSLVGKKISLTGESLFEGETRNNQSLAFEAFALNLPSQVNLLLPSKTDTSFKLGNFEVKGSIVVSERCQVPEVDASAFSATGRESDSDEGSVVSRTPLPKGLKVRHPLHGLDYSEKALPNFEAVISREQRHKKKKKNKLCNQDEGVAEFKKPLEPASKISRSAASSENESVRGVVVGKNLISLVSDDERSSKSEERIKKKKKSKQVSVEAEVDVRPDTGEDVKQSDKKKRKKEKLMEQMIREMECKINMESDIDDNLKKKKEKKRKRNLEIEESQSPVIENVLVSEEAQIVKKKKKKKAKTDSD